MKASQVLVLLCVFAVNGCADVPPEQPTKIEFDLSFVARWWSEDQMDGLDVDNPPPKEAEVTLRRWDASDPVGTPHPDEFDVVVLVAAGTDLSGVRIEVEQRWGIGDVEEGKATRWTDWEPAGQAGPTDLVAGANRIPLAKVRLDAFQQELFDQGEWPCLFEARARLTTADEAALNVTTGGRLEILAGD